MTLPAPQGSGYAYRKAITFDHTKVPNTDQSNFPVLINGTYGYLAPVAYGGNVQNINGYDVIFTSDSGCATKLNHEVESYNAATGAVNYWVKVPLVSHSSDTVIYLCYGSSSVTTDQSNKAGVWDANYKGIYHLPNGTTLSAADSTANGNNGIKGSSATAAAAQIGGGMILSGVNFANEHIQVTSNAGLRAGTITVSAWVKTTDATGNRYALTEDDSVTRNWRLRQTATQFQFSTFDTAGTESLAGSATNFSLNTWHYLVGVLDGAAGTVKLYVDGSNTATSSALAVNTGTIDMHIGQKGDGGLPWKGTLDEVRYSNAARSADWIATEYNNQNLPSTFYSISENSGNQAPVANAGGPYSGANGSAIQLNGSASLDPDGSITSSQWNFGDNTTGAGSAPLHTYASAGTYTATLTVTDNFGATAIANATVRVFPSTDQPPIANPGGPYSPNAGSTVQFTGSGSYDPDGTITSYHWDFGDGTAASVANPTHTFAATGSHLVSLTVTDNLGASSSKGVDVVVKTSGGLQPESVTTADVGWDPNNRSSMDDPRNDRGNAANRSTGNNNFQVVAPVLSLPGRGLDLSLNLVHNALVWNKSGNEIFFDIDHDTPAPGWQLGFGKIVAMGTAGAMIIEPDGTRHPFNGSVFDFAYTSGGITSHVQTFKGTTTDGSLIEYRCEMGVRPRAVARYPSGVVVYYANYTLDFSHGHNYTYPYFISDANGNSISIKYFLDTSEPRINSPLWRR